jgi:hypothetical protein
MYFCLRVDLDYVPWDTPDAKEFGHGEPAVLIRLLELASAEGARLHFFASNRTLRAFPSEAEAVLSAGHALDWFCKHPTNLATRWEEGIDLWQALGEAPLGLCVRGAWPESAKAEKLPAHFKFLSAAPGPVPAGVQLLPVETKSDREAARSGAGARRWADSVKTHMRQVASVYKGATVVVRPQVLGKFDPHLHHIKELIEFASAIEMRVCTLREAALMV